MCEALCKALLGCVHQIMDLKLPQIYAECLLPHVSSCLLPEALHRSMLRDANLHGSCPKPPPSNMTLAKLLRVPLGFAALGTLLVLLEYPYKAKIENGCPKRSRCPAPANQSARARCSVRGCDHAATTARNRCKRLEGSNEERKSSDRPQRNDGSILFGNRKTMTDLF